MTAPYQLPEHLQGVQAAIQTGFVNWEAGGIDGGRQSCRDVQQLSSAIILRQD